MSQQNWYHGKLANIVTGSANFAVKLAADAVVLGCTPAQATAFGLLDTALQSAYTDSITPETRTAVSIEARNIALAEVRQMAIGLAKLIYSVPTVNNDQLISLGLLPRTVPSPRPATTTPPIVEVVDVSGRLAKIRIHQLGLDTRARPIGSAGALVYSFVGNSAPTDPDEYKCEGLATRPIIEVLFPDSVASGATAFIAACWMSQRGERGFACTPVPLTIQGGPVLAAA